jgi:predicted cupin superfamily sugar epimerase
VPGPKARPRSALHPTGSRPEQARNGVTSLTVEEVIRLLGLTPHPEGGFFRETFRARESVAAPWSPVSRAASTAIYFLLRAGEFSAFHSVLSDEVWHHYSGASLELHTINRAGTHQRVELGPQLQHGECPQWVVPAGTLQAARVIGEGFALCGCTVAPGFDFADFDMPSRGALSLRYPALADLIESFTR